MGGIKGGLRLSLSAGQGQLGLGHVRDEEARRTRVGLSSGGIVRA